MKTISNMHQHLCAMQDKLHTLPHLERIGTLFSETVLLKIDEAEFYLYFEKGRLINIQTNSNKKIPWRFAFRVESDALNAFWHPLPKAGFHDIFGLVKIGKGYIDGDILCLVKNLRFFKEFMALGRVV